MEKVDFAKKLIKVRRERGLTQKEVAEKSNVTERTIQRIESGQVIPRSYTIKSISSALEFDYFISDINRPKNETKVERKSINYFSNKDLKNILNMKSRKMKIVIPVGILALSIGTVMLMNSKSATNKSAFEHQKQETSTTKERIEVTFTNNLTKDSLFKIQSDLITEGISLGYNQLEFDEKGLLQAIDCEVDCNDGYKGNFATQDLASITKSGQFGFYRDYSDNAKSNFGTGSL